MHQPHINTDMNDLTRETNDLVTYIAVKLAPVSVTPRQIAELRQTIYHSLERTYMAGYDTASKVATDAAAKAADDYESTH
jgi:hypothetical protein